MMTTMFSNREQTTNYILNYNFDSHNSKTFTN